MAHNDVSVEMILQHLGEEDHILGAVVPPIFQNSLFVHETCNTVGQAYAGACANKDTYFYSRMGNPTLHLAEQKIAALERTERCKLFGSGMGAISAAILSAVESGCHVVGVDSLYGPTRRFIEQYLTKFGVTSTFVSGSCSDSLLDAIRPETKLIVLESPSSLVFELQDLRRITGVAREKGIRTMIDNTYSAGILMQPHTLGVDLVVHSATKYFGGHSDIVAGAICGSAQLIDPILTQEYELIGGALAPFPAWLLIRGLRTLKVRLQAHQEVANHVAAYLAEQPEVERVLHISQPDFGQRQLYLSQMHGSGGLFSFIPRDQNPTKIRDFVDRLQVFQRGVSWGGFESLALSLDFASEHWQHGHHLVRLYCGLESAEDLIGDLRQALPALS